MLRLSEKPTVIVVASGLLSINRNPIHVMHRRVDSKFEFCDTLFYMFIVDQRYGCRTGRNKTYGSNGYASSIKHKRLRQATQPVVRSSLSGTYNYFTAIFMTFAPCRTMYRPASSDSISFTTLIPLRLYTS